MRDNDAFGFPARSRGIDHIGAAPSIQEDGGVAFGSAINDGFELPQGGRIQYQRRFRIFQHECDSRCGVLGVERKASCACFENSEGRNHHLDRPLNLDGDQWLLSGNTLNTCDKPVG